MRVRSLRASEKMEYNREFRSNDLDAPHYVIFDFVFKLALRGDPCERIWDKNMRPLSDELLISLWQLRLTRANFRTDGYIIFKYAIGSDKGAEELTCGKNKRSSIY